MVADAIQSLLVDVASLRGSTHITATVNATVHSFVSEVLMPVLTADIMADEEPIPSVSSIVWVLSPLWCLLRPFLGQTLQTLIDKLTAYDEAFAEGFRGVPVRQTIAGSP
jgi:hypothetical protein